ncbi:MAG: hypothetical protein HOP12_15310 [Candidatus Eisenbacteria bacterium]|uniref:FDX-ACB domain-containing protein n=1 Tax=Eiseniibacteriota bacterium TaxID=2212470 RepID=A0A849SNZ4_UNCEI|nr:hypothetical protein [Candidatus Eisenbacteria bacterium]
MGSGCPDEFGVDCPESRAYSASGWKLAASAGVALGASRIACANSTAAGEWLQTIELFDVYAGTGMPAGMKSLAFALQFQHAERTLEEAEVQASLDRMTAAVAKECGGRLRER